MSENQVSPNNTEIHNLLKKALKLLNLTDPKTNELIEKDKWTGMDLATVYTILRPYKKEKEIKNILDEIKNVKTKEMKELQGDWIPIEFKNGIPIKYAGWYNGNPYIKKITMSKEGFPNTILQKITLKNTDITNLKKFIKRINVDGEDMVEYHSEVFTKQEFVNFMVYPSLVNAFTEAINALPVTSENYKEPKMYVENGILKFPEHCFARRNIPFQKTLINAMNIGKTDKEIYEEGIKLLKRHPKQITLFYALAGANIINILRKEDFLYTIDAIGDSDTGKSYTINLALKLLYGIGDIRLKDDAINSSFRLFATLNATNLIIYIEEILMSNKTMLSLKSSGNSTRGHADQSLSTYQDLATLAFSRNTEPNDVVNIDPMEKKAQNKRILKFVFEPEDVITSTVEKNLGFEYFEKIKNLPSGLIYEKLKTKPIEEILKKYKDLKHKYNKSEAIVALLGAWIMDDAEFVPVLSEAKPPSILDEFFSKILDTWYRINSTPYDENGKRRLSFEDDMMTTNLMIDEVKHTFKITVNGFTQIKKWFDYKRNCKEFAQSYKFEYKTLKMDGKAMTGMTGKIPDKFFESEKNKENIKDEITDDEIKNKEIMDSLGL